MRVDTPSDDVLKHGRLQVDAALARGQFSSFRGENGVTEYHLLLEPRGAGNVAAHTLQLEAAYAEALETLELDASTAVYRRWFHSDIVNQVASSEGRTPLPGGPCAESHVGQAPRPPFHMALWAYHLHDPAGPLDKVRNDKHFQLKRRGLTHHWSSSITAPGEDANEETRGILADYETFLHASQLAFADNVIRTWFFVHAVDLNYGGLVEARRAWFARHGLTPETHYVSSTGIEGAPVDPRARVAMDAYAIGGIQDAQVAYLAAPDHLGPTDAYGVTFERGTAVGYRDRKHIFLSGTASIDPRGKIVHPGNVEGQLGRALENAEAILESAGARLNDLAMLIGYVRDPADQLWVEQDLRERFPDMPLLILHAPVCRPGWLVEVEGIAIRPDARPELPAY